MLVSLSQCCIISVNRFAPRLFYSGVLSCMNSNDLTRLISILTRRARYKHKMISPVRALFERLMSEATNVVVARITGEAT